MLELILIATATTAFITSGIVASLFVGRMDELKKDIRALNNQLSCAKGNHKAANTKYVELDRIYRKKLQAGKI